MTKTLPVTTKPTFVAPSQKKEDQSLASLVRENKLATTVALGAIAAASYGVYSYMNPAAPAPTPGIFDRLWSFGSSVGSGIYSIGSGIHSFGSGVYKYSGLEWLNSVFGHPGRVQNPTITK